MAVAALGGVEARERAVSVLARADFDVVWEGSEPEELVDAGVVADVTVVACDRLDEAKPWTKLLRARFPDARLVVVTSAAGRRAFREVIEEGVDAVVLAMDVEKCLPLALNAVLSGQLVIPGQLREHITKPALSVREKQILAMVVMGFTNGEIARKLFVAESTVKSHLSSAFVKMGVRSRNEATALILDAENGLGTGILAISEDAPALGSNG